MLSNINLLTPTLDHNPHKTSPSLPPSPLLLSLLLSLSPSLLFLEKERQFMKH